MRYTLEELMWMAVPTDAIEEKVSYDEALKQTEKSCVRYMLCVISRILMRMICWILRNVGICCLTSLGIALDETGEENYDN